MNLNDIKTKARGLVKVTNSSWTDANLLIDLNITLDNIGDIIVSSQDESDFDDKNHTDFPIKTADLIAEQQSYLFPTRLLNIKRMEVKLDGSNWRKAEPIDIGEIGGSVKNAVFHTDSPFYDMAYGSFFLYPTPKVDVQDGIEIWCSRDVKSFTLEELVAGILEPGFDRPFHIMLAVGSAYEFAKTNQLPIQEVLKRDWQELEDKLRKHYGRKNKDRQIILKPAYIDYN